MPFGDSGPQLSRFFFFFPVGIANGPAPKLFIWLLAGLLCTSGWSFSSPHVHGCGFIYISCILDGGGGGGVAARAAVQRSSAEDQSSLISTSLGVPFQMSSSLPSLPPRHLKPRLRPFHCFDTRELLYVHFQVFSTWKIRADSTHRQFL